MLSLLAWPQHATHLQQLQPSHSSGRYPTPTRCFKSERCYPAPHESNLEARQQMPHNLEHLKPFPSITAPLALLKLSYIFCEAKALHRQSVQNRRGQRQWRATWQCRRHKNWPGILGLQSLRTCLTFLTCPPRSIMIPRCTAKSPSCNWKSSFLSLVGMLRRSWKAVLNMLIKS